MSELLYRARYRIGEYALRGFVASLPWIPYRMLVAFTHGSAWIVFRCLWDYRRRMLANVTTALGESMPDPAARERLVWRAWQNFARSVLETSAIMHFSRERILATVRLDGEEHLQRALAAGRGVIALSAHLGSFAMIGGRLAAGGYPFSVVVKHPGDERFAQLMNDYRAQIGIDTISAKPRREAARGILRALRQNRIVLVIADEFKSGGVQVDFLGQRSSAPRGPATLALRTKAVTLPLFAVRQTDGAVVISIGAELRPVEKGDLEESVAATTALFTRELENAIRRWPDQWAWLGFPRADRASRARRGRRRVGAPARDQRQITETAEIESRETEI